MGLLEKKKDYVQRARDFHRKKDAITKLQEKAELRNPDEFYFAMEKSKTKDGVHVVNKAEEREYTQEQLALMRTQDTRYLGLKSKHEARRIERLREGLHFVGARARNSHTVFVDSEREARDFRAEEHFDTPAELLDRAFNRVRWGPGPPPAPARPPAPPLGPAPRPPPPPLRAQDGPARGPQVPRRRGRP